MLQRSAWECAVRFQPCLGLQRGCSHVIGATQTRTVTGVSGARCRRVVNGLNHDFIHGVRETPAVAGDKARKSSRCPRINEHRSPGITARRGEKRGCAKKAPDANHSRRNVSGVEWGRAVSTADYPRLAVSIFSSHRARSDGKPVRPTIQSLHNATKSLRVARKTEPGPRCGVPPSALSSLQPPSFAAPLTLQRPYSTQSSPATDTKDEQDHVRHSGRPPRNGDGDQSLGSRMVEAAATSFASILVLAAGFGIAGYAYHKTYKHLVLKKMQNAFEPGDPVLELAAMGKGMIAPSFPGQSGAEAYGATHWVQRPEQARVDAIVDGTEVGHYHLMIGEKGTGKSSMLLEAMRKIDGDGVAMFEAHADLEIFRIRLGKALDYEFHEDYIGGYFSERGPRDTTALLDIERALNKLEKVALLRRVKTPGRPLVLIINQMHLVRDDEDGKDLLELLQQRAEQWAASNLVTMVFNSDDYWVYERFKQLATRMEVLSVQDLAKAPATAALMKYRQRYFGEKVPEDMAEKIYDKVGGRLTFLNRVAKSSNMLETCDRIIEVEKTWFLNQCWVLGAEMDDDVMDQQKWAAAAMVLALALVDLEPEMERTYDPVKGHVLPSFPLHIAQEIMTRADFVRALDRLNLFSITSTAQVRASSVPMHIAFRKICGEERFRAHLEATVKRISDIESLGRTRELVAKDLVLGGRYEIEKKGGGAFGGPARTVVSLKEQEGEEGLSR